MMTTLEKVKISYEIASLLDNEDLKANFLTLKGGDFAYNVFRLAIEQEVEKLMAPEKVVEQLDIARESIQVIISDIRQLQESLMEMVTRAITLRQGDPNLMVRRGRSRNTPLSEDTEQIQVTIPDDPQPISF
jgi:pyruvate kinase